MPFSIDIDFDYFYNLNPSPLFDPNTPDGQKARATVVKAASDWAQYIASDFVEVPALTNVQVANPSDPAFPNLKEPISLSTPIQDVRIFIGTRPFSSVGINIAQANTGDVPKPQNITPADINDYDFLNAARSGINRQPSVASITFISTQPFQVDYTQPVASNQYDLYTVAVHEIFHTLAAERNGFLSTTKPALAFDVNLNTGSTFFGANATSVVPSTSGRQVIGDHFVASTMSPPVGGGTPLIPELLIPQYGFGDRKAISQLDLAVLADVGYKIINAGFTPTPISLTAPAPFLNVSGYAVAGTKTADNITGNTGNDTLAGGLGNDVIYGMDGNDYISGGAGRNTLYGEAGDDTLTSGDGTGTLDGGDGNDTLIVLPNAVQAKGILFGGSGKDTLIGGRNSDKLNGGTEDDSINGNAGNDIINGDDGADTLYGDGDNDSITGGSGRDSIYGGSGNDTLLGDGGNDALFGGFGNDTLFGGLGTNNLQGFDIALPSATEVDILFHSGGSFNRFFLSDGGVNGYKQGGVGDYALIKNYLPGLIGSSDTVVVANIGTTGRVLVGGNINIYDNSNGSELIAIVEGITNPLDVRLSSSVVPLP